MATPIDHISFNELVPTMKALAQAGGTTDHLGWVRSRDNAELVITFINKQRGFSEKNPYKMTVDQQLAALRRANNEEKWGITKEDLARLADTAPDWPQGKQAYRSPRIRFGEGDGGVAKTFEAHYGRIQQVFGEGRYRRWEHLHSSPTPYKGKPVERLRLLSGNHTHEPVIEWVVADLDTHRKRDSIMAVRGVKSLADELLVIAWMFPDMIRAIDCYKLPGLFAAGYEVNVPENDDGAWQSVACVTFNRDYRYVDVGACDRSNDFLGYSVPVLRKSPALGT